MDWSKGNGFPYEKATANTQVVGTEIALFIKYLMNEYGLSASDFHIIGHSLGAHVAGYAGQKVNGLGRITGNIIVLKMSRSNYETVLSIID